MPMSRYEIRNEFSLADRELYQAADKDDPEALLEGFAMASLVGVLRQLGDLAQFATEVFSDLHDEVAATAARGHGLMVRVHQLEMELPLIEKAFLKHTYHSSFFYSAGIDWHPNLNTYQNCITKRDLPRFIMDSYEEARGPPRLFLLDKFDVGGAGACLKRYTNPSLYKVEAIALETTNSVEKKSRKVKRRATHRRNERARGAFPTPHSKLHQLLLEEKIEDNASDPACHVKLKRRLNVFPLHMKTGKSYMEKILKDCSPDHKLLEEVFIGPVASHLEAEVESLYNGSESPGIELTNKNPVASDLEAEVGSHYNGSESPDTELTSKTPSPKLETENVFSNVFSGELDFMTSDGRHYDSPKGNHIFGAHNSSYNLHGDVCEKKIIVDRESKGKTNVVGYQYDDVTNEVEIFINTLSSYPQMDSDPKLKAMIDFHVSSNRKQVLGLGVTKSQHQAHFPDSQSMGSSNLSDDGITLLKKCISTSSSSDGVSEIAGSTHLESEVSNAHLFNEIFKAKSTSSPLKWRGCDAGCNDVADNLTLSSENSELTVSNGIPAQRHEDGTLGDHGVSKVQSGGLVAQGLPTESEIKLEQNAPFNSDSYTSPRQWGYGCSFGGFASNQTLASVQDKHPNMHESLSCVPHLSDTSYSRRASKDQEENLSTCSPKWHLLNGSADGDSNNAEDPPKLTPEESSLKELDRDILNETSSTCSENHSGNFREFTSITHSGEMGAASCGSFLSIDLSDADVERDETDLSRYEIETGVSEAGDENLVPKSYPNQRGNSNHLDIEEYQSISSLPLVENKKNQRSCFDLLTQGNDTIGDVGTPSEPLGSISPNLLPEAAKITLEEVPPMPPLPPVQWRNGGNQPISLAHDNEALSDNEGPSLSQSMIYQKTPRQGFMGEDLPQVHESTSGNPFHDGPFSSLVNYILLNEVHLRSQNLSSPGNKTNTPSLGEIESMAQKLPVAANLDEISQHDDHIRPNSNTIFHGTTADVTAAGDTGQAPDLEAMFQQKGPRVTRSKDNFFVQCSPCAEGSASTLEGDPAPSKTENEQPRVTRLFPRGESTWQSEAEEKTNDVQAMKLPRLRNPLVDALAAHDNTKLKKVKDRTGPKIQISDGRDSLLEQIRAKSFNLKPTVVKRPSIQGPTTNLRVTAILEKAKTIRHAFAGSDADDDSWSD